jgi:two-component system cell cycle response regulator
MPKFAQVLVASGDPMERARLDGMLAKQDYGCLMADGAADIAAIARERRPDALLLSGTLGDAELGGLVGALRDDPETASIPVMLVAARSSEALRQRCVALAVEDLVEGPLDDAVILVRLRPLARLATLQAETHRRTATARDFGLSAETPVLQSADQDDCRVLVVGSPGDTVEAVAPALGADVSLEFEADPYRAGATVEESRYDAVIVVVDAGANPERSLYLSSHIRGNPSLFNLPVLMVYGEATLDKPSDAYRAGASIALAQPVDPSLLRTSLMLLVKRQQRRWDFREALDLTLVDAARDRGNRTYNADFLRAHLGRLIAAARRGDKHLTLAVFSIRNLEDIEGRHGAEAAELLMTKVADWIGGLVRAEDLTGRLGGSEFCTIFPDTGIDDARIAVHRVSAVLQLSDFALTEEIMEPIRVWVESGIASLADGDSLEGLVARARADTL